MEIKTVKASVIKTLCDSLKELISDVCIDITSDGIKIVAVDNSRVLLVHLKLDAESFEIFHTDGPKKLGVNMLNFYKIIKTINSNDTLTLFMKKNDNDQLGIRIVNEEKYTTSTYSMNLLELDADNISIPAIEFSDVVTLPSTDFQKICRDMDHIAEFVEIKMVNRELILTCRGDFCTQTTIIKSEPEKAHISSLDGGQRNGDEIIQCVFSLKYLSLFTRCTNLSDRVQLFLKNDFPLVVKYSVATLGEIKLCLAPRSNKN